MLSEKELRDHFNMPLNEVAKKFGMCTTALKKLCRKYGVMQWPHRKLRSLEKKIASLRAEQVFQLQLFSSLNISIKTRLLRYYSSGSREEDKRIMDTPLQTVLEATGQKVAQLIPPALSVAHRQT